MCGFKCKLTTSSYVTHLFASGLKLFMLLLYTGLLYPVIMTMKPLDTKAIVTLQCVFLNE